MSKSLRTLIEWAHYTLNFWRGCAKVSEACRNCYALGIAQRLWKGTVQWGKGGKRELRYEPAQRKLAAIVRAAKREAALADPLQQRKPERVRVFVNSVSDTFEDHWLLGSTRQSALLLMEQTPEVDFLLLTKRPENILKMVPPEWLGEGKWPAHIWIGTTVEDQKTADERIPHLVEVPARVRFLSCEPMLRPVDLKRWFNPTGIHCLDVCADSQYVDPTRVHTVKVGGLVEPLCPRCGLVAGWTGYDPVPIHWVICGGESGRGARPMHPDWVQSLRFQCFEAGVPFFFKQWGNWAPGECVGKRKKLRCATYVDHGEWSYSTETAKQAENCHADDAPDMYHLGKKQAGRKLDGVEHNGLPEVRS